MVLLAIAVLLFMNKPATRNGGTPIESQAVETDVQQGISEEESANSLPTTDVETTTIDAETQLIIDKLKARAERDWPDDYTTQEYWVNQQIEDYSYMLQIEDNSIKRKAQRDWPLDFSTQKYWYDEQIRAKERLK